MIQVPIFISGGNCPNFPRLGYPIMLPTEVDPPNFQIPPNVIIDTSNTLVHESKQVDKLIFNNLDFRGDFVSIGVFDSAYFNGMNLANNVFVLTDGPFSGIQYESIEIITFNFGDGVDLITVNNTTQAIHVMNLGGSSDTLNIKSLLGPLVVNGKDGNNTATVS